MIHISRNKTSINQTVISQSYLPSLDGFRAISIIMVIFSHVYFHSNGIVHQLFSGTFGVQIFFVISGFLITTLLLKENQQKGSISLKRFYIRRVLRIFPVAYLFLLVLIIMDHYNFYNISMVSYIKSFTYTRNLSLPTGSGDWETGHFWSLAVEEQFYLFAPFLIKKNIRIYSMIAIGLLIFIPILHFATFHHLIESNWLVIMDDLFCNQTAILIGSLFAIFFFHGQIKFRTITPTITTLTCLTLLLTASILQSNLITILPDVITPLLSSICIAFAIIICIHPTQSTIQTALNLPAIKYIGVLSYSLYIWQQIFTQNVAWGAIEPFKSYPVINIVLLVAISAFSYHCYERYFLKLKSKFAF